jgi:hypothetical protein
MANYTGFLAPKVALFSNIALMVAMLLWRPQGVYPVTNRYPPSANRLPLSELRAREHHVEPTSLQ